MLNSHSIKSTAGLKCLILPLHIFLCDYTTYSTVFISSASRGERTLIYFGIAILFLTSLRARDIHTEDRKQRCSESGCVPIKVPEMLSIRAYWSAQFRALPADSIQPIRIDESKITHSSNSHTHTTGLDLGIFISYISGTHTHTRRTKWYVELHFSAIEVSALIIAPTDGSECVIDTRRRSQHNSISRTSPSARPENPISLPRSHHHAEIV